MYERKLWITFYNLFFFKKIESASEAAAQEAFGGVIFDNSRMDLIPDDESIFEGKCII